MSVKLNIKRTEDASKKQMKHKNIKMCFNFTKIKIKCDNKLKL
jgi:hypothetical protein